MYRFKGLKKAALAIIGFCGCWMLGSAAQAATAPAIPNKMTELLPFFQRAGVQFPPKQLALLIFKKNQRLDLWAKDANHKGWVQIRSFSILAASGNPGPKLEEGDHQVPEGIYHITRLNPYSHFDLSMGLDYPNAFDRETC